MSHIAIVLRSLPWGGAERTVLTVAGGLIARGHRVDLVLLESEVAMVGEVPAAARLFILQGHRNHVPLELTVVPEWRDERAHALQWLKLTTSLLRRFPGDAASVMNARALRYALRLQHYARRERPDIVFANLPSAELGALYAACLADFPPVVPVVHGRVRLRQTRRRRLLLPMAAHVIAVSHALAETLSSETGTPTGRISVVHNPTDMVRVRRLSAEAPNHPWFVDGGAPVVLSAAGFLRKRTSSRSSRPLRRVNDRRPCRLVILGEGPARGEIEHRIHKLRLEEHVSLPGWMENPFSYMSRAQLFVLTSLHEGLGNVLVEAMACGCPQSRPTVREALPRFFRIPICWHRSATLTGWRFLSCGRWHRSVDQVGLQAKTARFAMERAMLGYEAVIAAAAAIRN